MPRNYTTAPCRHVDIEGLFYWIALDERLLGEGKIIYWKLIWCCGENVHVLW